MPVGYGDVAILLRGLTDIRVYEEAFARHSVPAIVTAGGRGYYARYEIQDLLSVLTLLDSPLDDLALLTALRSPFVGADVDTIYRLCMLARDANSGTGNRPERGPLYPVLQQLLISPELPADEREKVEPFINAVDSLRRDVDRIPIGRLIDRLIAGTNYDMRLVCRPGGRRKLANIRKLVQIALEEPGLSVCEFVGRMRNLQVLSDREGDAPTAEEGAGVVRIMTIHSAKGSEFPIVVLPDLSRGLVSPETGLFTCDPVSVTIGARTCGEPDAAYRAIAKHRQEADKREYLRLLYVAMTRAREHLILCGNVGRNRGFNWADAVFPALGITSVPAAAERLTLNGGIEAMVAPLTQLYADGGISSAASSSSYEEGERLAEALLRTML
jgi:ATP-dependent helicase/nuclease subunit A